MVAVKTPEMFLEKRMAGRCEIKRKILLLENLMAGCCEIDRSLFFKGMTGSCNFNRSILEKKWLVAVKLTEVFLKMNDWSL